MKKSKTLIGFSVFSGVLAIICWLVFLVRFLNLTTLAEISVAELAKAVFWMPNAVFLMLAAIWFKVGAIYHK